MSAWLILLAGVAAGPSWDYLGDLPKPAPLSACPGKADAVINYNNHAYGRWYVYCYYGGPGMQKVPPAERRSPRPKAPLQPVPKKVQQAPVRLQYSVLT